MTRDGTAHGIGMARRAAGALAALVLIAGLVHVAPVAAAGLPAPTLLSPSGVTVTDTLVDFGWERVPGAAGYVLRVRHESADGPEVLSTTTVNDRYIGVVNLAGDEAYWEVAAFNGNGQEGDVASATFTTARIAPTLTWPPDGATVTHPDAWPQPGWTLATGDPAILRATQDAGEGVPEAFAPTSFGLGTWRWGMRSEPQHRDPVADRPTSEARTFTVAWRDATPVLASPADGATLDPDASLRLRWNAVPGAARYEWLILPPGGDIQVRLGSTRATWADIDTDWFAGDISGGTWEWRVRAVMSYTDATPAHSSNPVYGPWSERRSFTLPGTPAAPVPSSPADGAVLDHWPVLAWDPVPGTHGYTVEINDAPEPVADPANGLEPTTGSWFSFAAPGGDTNPMAVAAPGAVTRYWRVHAYGTRYDAGGQAVSGWRSFTVTAATPITAPETATLTGPDDCASDACADLPGRPLLTWQPVDGASFYRVFLRWGVDAGATDIWLDTGSTGLVPPAMPGLAGGGRVTWSVVACPTGACTETMPDARRQFRIDFAPPVQAGPPDGTVQATPAVEMAWLPAVREVGGPDVVVPTRWEVEWTIVPGAYGDPEDRYRAWTPFTNWTHGELPDGASVTWRVRAYEPYGSGPGEWATGAWSPLRRTTRTVPAVTLVSPAADAVLEATPVLDWAEQPYPVKGYAVSVVKEITLAHWPSTSADWSTITGATSARLPDLAPGRYRWRVLDFDGTAASTGWFTIAGDPRPQAISPVAGASVRADDVVFEWAPYASHEWYAALNVQVATTPAFAEGDVVRSWPVERNATVFAPRDALPSGDLYWRVCATWECSLPTPVGGDARPEGTAGAEAASELYAASTPRLLHILTAPGPDTTPPIVASIAVTPVVGRQVGTSGSTPVRLAWTATDVGSGIGAQTVQLRRGTAGWVSLPVSATARTATASLVAGSTYTIRVRATDAAGNATGWVERRVTTTLRQETSSLWTWSGTWTRRSASTALGGFTRGSTRLGASATLRVSASAVGIVAPRSTTRGSARVYIDGHYATTIRLDASPLGSRRLVWVTAWPAVGSHRVTVRVVGTAGHPRVDLDAVVVIR